MKTTIRQQRGRCFYIDKHSDGGYRLRYKHPSGYGCWMGDLGSIDREGKEWWVSISNPSDLRDVRTIILKTPSLFKAIRELWRMRCNFL